MCLSRPWQILFLKLSRIDLPPWPSSSSTASGLPFCTASRPCACSSTSCSRHCMARTAVAGSRKNEFLYLNMEYHLGIYQKCFNAPPWITQHRDEVEVVVAEIAQRGQRCACATRTACVTYTVCHFRPACTTPPRLSFLEWSETLKGGLYGCSVKKTDFANIVKFGHFWGGIAAKICICAKKCSIFSLLWVRTSKKKLCQPSNPWAFWGVVNYMLGSKFTL